MAIPWVPYGAPAPWESPALRALLEMDGGGGKGGGDPWGTGGDGTGGTAGGSRSNARSPGEWAWNNPFAGYRGDPFTNAGRGSIQRTYYNDNPDAAFGTMLNSLGISPFSQDRRSQFYRAQADETYDWFKSRAMGPGTPLEYDYVDLLQELGSGGANNLFEKEWRGLSASQQGRNPRAFGTRLRWTGV